MGNAVCGFRNGVASAHQNLGFRLIAYNVFKQKDRIPAEPDINDTIDAKEVNLMESFVIYISYNEAAFTAQENQLYQLIVEGVEKIKVLFATQLLKDSNIYLFIEKVCQSDDLEFYKSLTIEPNKKTKTASKSALKGVTLYDIMAVCDAVLTPVVLPAPEKKHETSPSSPDRQRVGWNDKEYSSAFATPPRQHGNIASPSLASHPSPSMFPVTPPRGPSPNSKNPPAPMPISPPIYGFPHSYLTESQNCWMLYLKCPWVRVELLYCCSIPLKDTAKSKNMFKGALALAQALGRRLHLVIAASFIEIVKNVDSRSSRDPISYRMVSSSSLMVLPYITQVYKQQLKPAMVMNHHTPQSAGINSKIGYHLRELTVRPVYDPTKSLPPLDLLQQENVAMDQLLSNAKSSSVCRLVLSNGGCYLGEVDEHGHYHGDGLMVSSTYDKCMGTWVRGAMHGDSCCIKYATGDVYAGSMVRNKRHGFGSLVSADGTYYHGEWVHGVRQGHGKSYDAKLQHVYVGEFVNGVSHGSGNITYKNGSTFVGNFVGGKRQGAGKLVRAVRKRGVTSPASVLAESLEQGDASYAEKGGEYEVHEGQWHLDVVQL